MVSVRKLQSITSISTNFMAVSLTSKISVIANVRSSVYRYHKRKISNGIILEASACDVTFRPNLISKSDVTFG